MTQCSVSDCDNPSRTKRLCKKHYARLLRHGHVDQTRVRGECSLPDCHEPHSSLGYCKAHAARQRRHGDPTVVRMGPGEQNPNWQGDGVGYVGAHKRVHRARGQASAHTCVDCGALAAQWSYNHTDPDELSGISRADIVSRYSADPSYYDPRCHPCHRAFDRDELTA